ncbi:class I SAM-dependent methyltransferase [bacterium]|nr:class I SAM-dependent methyltransferase [bacterium]
MTITLESSFRDPSGFVFEQNGQIFRQVNPVYKIHYDHLLSSGLAQDLISKNCLIPFIESPDLSKEGAYKILKAEKIPFISYPYEWSFSQLKDAALLTLKIALASIQKGMILKDATAYNIQFYKGKPILIDLLSFEKYEEGTPWVAYKQFCQHFLAPLALMARVDIRLVSLLKNYIDGIPLDLASQLLPFSTKFSFAYLTHIHWHAKTQAKYSDAQTKVVRKLPKNSLVAMLSHLQDFIKSLEWTPQGTEWADYYSDTNYTSGDHEEKKKIILDCVGSTAYTQAWDLGANTGLFSRVLAEKGIPVISFDIDPACIEKNYRQCKKENRDNILPLFSDLTNPSPGLGWAHSERDSMMGRGPAPLVMALALIHHLALSNNVPLHKVASFFGSISQNLIIEFVPKEDSQVKRLLATREDIFPHYNESGFEEAFGSYFSLIKKQKVGSSHRTLYFFKKI